MKQPDQVKRRILAEWLHKAGMDVELAEHLHSEGIRFPSAIAFHCQQAAEKYVKAFLVWHEINQGKVPGTFY